MSSQLAFDEESTRALDAAYQTKDMRRRRGLARGLLAAQPGERILDVGCGPGYYLAELLEEVGPEGSLVGVDSSPQMLAVAQDRVGGAANVAFAEGEATRLPVGDADFDAALIVQVLEYVADADVALRELHRAVRPGGRVLVWDVDWATVSWYSAEPQRMARVMAAWDRHLAHPALPQTLGDRLRGAGFQDVRAEGHLFTADVLSDDVYVGALYSMIESFVRGTGAIPEDELAAWSAEQRELSDRGAFSFTCVQFGFTATRP